MLNIIEREESHSGYMPEYVHRIGGASVENLRLKPREVLLAQPGISVIKASTPEDAVKELMIGLPRAKILHELANTIGTARIEDIRKTGFEVIAAESVALPNHHRIIHPMGAEGFNDENLARLGSVFQNTTGYHQS